MSPKYKEYYQNNKRGSANVIEIESPVDNITATSGASNTVTKMSSQKPTTNVFRNTQGLQGSIYSASNSIDVRTKIEKEGQYKSKDQLPSEPEQVPMAKRAFTQSGKVRLKTEAINRIREAKKRAENLIGKEGNNAVFQYQFEMQNKDEES